MNHKVLFRPFVTVEVTETFEVVGVTTDWHDTLLNDFQGDDEVWSDANPNDPPWTTLAAASFLDGEELRKRVLIALQPVGDEAVMASTRSSEVA